MHVFRFFCALFVLAAVYCGSREALPVEQEPADSACIQICEETLSEYAEIELGESVLAASEVQSSFLSAVKCDFGWSYDQYRKQASRFAMGCRPPPECSDSTLRLVI